MYEVKCIICGNKFNSRVNFAKFCSKDCREIKLKEYQDKYRKQKGLEPIVRTKSVHCVVCGRYFKQIQAHQKYCSRVCRNKVTRLAYNKVKKTRKYQRFCKCCLNKFETNVFNKKFCSEQCRKKQLQTNYIKERENCKKECLVCKQEFVPTRVFKECCSEDCNRLFKKNKSIFIKRETGYRWLLLRFKVLNRDNFKCKYCGRSSIEDNIKLHVDHILPISKDGLNELNNLVTACEDCNLGKRDILLEKYNVIRLKNSI